jgi:hypothetical protein
VPDLPGVDAVRVRGGGHGWSPVRAVAVDAVSLGHWMLAGRRYKVTEIQLYSGRMHFLGRYSLRFGEEVTLNAGMYHINIRGRDDSVIVRDAPLHISAVNTVAWPDEPDRFPPFLEITFPIAMTSIEYRGGR